MQYLAHLVLLDLRMGLANDLIPKTPILVNQYILSESVFSQKAQTFYRVSVHQH